MKVNHLFLACTAFTLSTLSLFACNKKNNISFSIIGADYVTEGLPFQYAIDLVTPDASIDKTVTWSIDDTSKADINNNGILTVKPNQSLGSTFNIIAISNYNKEIKQSKKVEILPSISKDTFLEGIKSGEQKIVNKYYNDKTRKEEYTTNSQSFKVNWNKDSDFKILGKNKLTFTDVEYTIYTPETISDDMDHLQCNVNLSCLKEDGTATKLGILVDGSILLKNKFAEFDSIIENKGQYNFDFINYVCFTYLENNKHYFGYCFYSLNNDENIADFSYISYSEDGYLHTKIMMVENEFKNVIHLNN